MGYPISTTGTGVKFEVSQDALKKVYKEVKRWTDILYRKAKREYRKIVPHKYEFTDKVGGKGTDVISLKDQAVRVAPGGKYKAILANDYFETKNTSLNKARELKRGRVKTIGDSHIPVSNFSLWNGIENGSFKTAPLQEFNDTTTVFPVRNIKRGTKPIKGIYVNPKNPNNKAIFGISVDNDTIPFSNYNTQILDSKKLIFGNNSGNSLFIGDFTQLSPQQFDFINRHLRANPSYPVRTDLGSFELYNVNNPTYEDYMNQFVEPLGRYNDKYMYIIGTR